MRSFLFGFRFVRLLLLVAGLILLAFSGIQNALFYTKTRGEVVRVEERCVPTGARLEEATGCLEAIAKAGGKRVRRYTMLHLRYTSPADGQVHEGVVIPVGRKAVEAAKLRAGDRFPIYVHDRKAEEIKAE